MNREQNRIGSGTLWFLCALAILPIAYLPGFGTGYREIKTFLLWIVSGVAGLQLALHTRKNPLRLDVMSGSAIALSAIIAFLQLVSVSYALNIGLAIERGLTSLSATVIMLYVVTRNITVRAIAGSLCIPLAVVVSLIVARSYADFTLVRQGAGLGALVGERNSAAIFVAQLIPLATYMIVATSLTTIWSRVATFVGLTVSLLAVFLPRTRTAWGMLVFVVLVGGLFALRRSEGAWKRFGSVLVCGIAAALIFLNAIPHHLAWRSDTPYSDSVYGLVPTSNPNGRFDLWRVGIAMFFANPITGVGAGNFAVTMRGFVADSGADPSVFGFLRGDLPLFNDYLQGFVETGIVGGVLFALFYFAIPVSFLGIFVARRLSIPLDSGAGVLSCCAAALASLFDYPLLRPETLAIFAATLGAVLRKEGSRSETSVVAPDAERAPIFVSLCLASSILVCAAISYGLSFGSRKISRSNGSLHLLDLAWKLWPWDSEWTEKYPLRLKLAGFDDAAARYVHSRVISWPEDPRTYLTIAEIAYADRRYEAAMKGYRRALYEVRGGRCHGRTIAYLGRFLRDSQVPASNKAEIELAVTQCRNPARTLPLETRED